MGYRFEIGESVEDELRRIACEQLDKALGEIDDRSIDRHRTVHQVRKRMKKVRGLARLVRKAFDGYDDANEAARDAARRVSDVRDAKVFVDTYDALVAPHGSIVDLDALAPIRNALVAHREETARAHLEEEDRLALVRRDLVALRERAADWSLDEKGFDAIRGGLAKTYGRARDAMEDAYEAPTPEAFHEWRKRVKYHRYHVRLLRDLWEGPLEALRDELHELTDHLGDSHDLHELEQRVASLGREADLEEPIHVLRALAGRRRMELREAARGLGEKAFAEDPDALTARMHAVWRAAA